MFHRIAWLGWPGLLVTAGFATAKPPGPPVDPHCNGHEPPPVERDFHQPPATTTRMSYYRPLEADRATDAAPLVEWFAWLHATLEDGITIELGTVKVGE